MVKPKEQILVTGGMGFIGRYLIPVLVKRGYFPIIVDKISIKKAVIVMRSWGLKKDKDFLFIYEDMRNKRALYKKLLSLTPSAAIHLAAIHMIPYCELHKQETISTNLKGTQIIFNISHRLGVKKFIFISTAAVYMPSKKPHKESDPLAPIDIYGISKLKAENYILANKNLYNGNISIIRLFNVYGKNDANSHFIPAILKQLKKSPTIFHGDLNTVRDYIYIQDVVDGVIKVLMKNVVKNIIYNLGSGEGYSGREVLNTISRIIKHDLVLKKKAALFRKTDRNKLVASNRRFSREFKWFPRHTLSVGLTEMLKK